MATTFFTKTPSADGRRFPSPSAQMRFGEQWRVRLGLIATTLLMLGVTASFLRFIQP